MHHENLFFQKCRLSTPLRKHSFASSSTFFLSPIKNTRYIWEKKKSNSNYSSEMMLTLLLCVLAIVKAQDPAQGWLGYAMAQGDKKIRRESDREHGTSVWPPPPPPRKTVLKTLKRSEMDSSQQPASTSVSLLWFVAKLEDAAPLRDLRQLWILCVSVPQSPCSSSHKPPQCPRTHWGRLRGISGGDWGTETQWIHNCLKSRGGGGGRPPILLQTRVQW